MLTQLWLRFWDSIFRHQFYRCFSQLIGEWSPPADFPSQKSSLVILSLAVKGRRTVCTYLLQAWWRNNKFILMLLTFALVSLKDLALARRPKTFQSIQTKQKTGVELLEENYRYFSFLNQVTAFTWRIGETKEIPRYRKSKIALEDVENQNWKKTENPPQRSKNKGRA